MSSQNVIIRKLRGLLQLLAISYYLTEFGIMIIIYPFLLLFLYFACWPLALAYTCWYLYDYGQHERGGRQFAFFKRCWHWRLASSYFPVQLIKTVDLPPDRNYLFCLQPHGLFSLGTIFSLVTNGAGFQEKFKGLKQHILTVPAQVVTPFHREISMALGYVSASKKSLLHILDRKRKGNVAMLMLGGSVETIYAQQNTMNVCIANRKGFIKVAYQTGAPLVPVIVFGENNMYNVRRYPDDHLVTKIQKRLASWFNVTFVVFKGRGLFTKYFGVLPYRTPINTVVGRPIEFEQTDNPSQEQIDTLHARYLDALQGLYDEYNPIYGNKQVSLNIM